MNIKRINKSLHKWLSILFGVILFIICITGAMLVFQKEILELSHPSHYKIKAGKEKAISLDRLIPIVNKQLENNSVASVEISKDRNRTYKMSLKEGFRVVAFVNQYTGEVVGEYAPQEHIFFSIMRLHRWLLDSTRTWGKNLVGWTAIVFILLIITGLSYFSKKAKENYIIHFNKGSRRLVFGLHNTLGVYASILLLIMAFSGLMWSFDWYRNGVFHLFGDKTQPNTGHQKRERKRGSDETTLAINVSQWQNILEKTLNASGKYDYVKISDGNVSAHPDNTYRTRVQDKYTFDPQTSEITDTVLFKDQDVKTRVWAWAYSLHVGDYWGIWSKVLSFLACLIGASLVVTGYYIMISRWLRKHRTKKL